jgi:hypothetical protein
MLPPGLAGESLLDLLEPMRPEADRQVLRLIMEEKFFGRTLR